MAEQALYLRDDVEAFQYETELDGTTYQLTFSWNARAGQWYLDVRDASGGDLVLGLPLVVDFPLLQTYRSVEGLPPGELLVVDLEGRGGQPGLGEWNSRYQVLYYDTEAMAALAATRSA